MNLKEQNNVHACLHAHANTHTHTFTLTHKESGFALHSSTQSASIQFSSVLFNPQQQLKLQSSTEEGSFCAFLLTL